MDNFIRRPINAICNCFSATEKRPFRIFGHIQMVAFSETPNRISAIWLLRWHLYTLFLWLKIVRNEPVIAHLSANVHLNDIVRMNWRASTWKSIESMICTKYFCPLVRGIVMPKTRVDCHTKRINNVESSTTAGARNQKWSDFIFIFISIFYMRFAVAKISLVGG